MRSDAAVGWARQLLVGACAPTAALVGPPPAVAEAIRMRLRSWRFDGYLDWPSSASAPAAAPATRNWYVSSGRGVTREQLEERAASIDCAGLMRVVEAAVAGRYGPRAIDSAWLFGSVLYGRPEVEPHDVDVLAIVAGDAVAENNVAFETGELADAFLPVAGAIQRRPRVLGLATVSAETLATTHAPADVLDILVECVHVGHPLTPSRWDGVEAPPAVLAYKPLPLLAWGLKEVCYGDARAVHRGFTRVAEAAAIVDHLYALLSLGPARLPPHERILARTAPGEGGPRRPLERYARLAGHVSDRLGAVWSALRSRAERTLDESLVAPLEP